MGLPGMVPHSSMPTLLEPLQLAQYGQHPAPPFGTLPPVMMDQTGLPVMGPGMLNNQMASMMFPQQMFSAAAALPTYMHPSLPLKYQPDQKLHPQQQQQQQQPHQPQQEPQQQQQQMEQCNLHSPSKTIACHALTSHAGQGFLKSFLKEKRKQSNRDSARRSRLRKLAESEQLGGNVDSLQARNKALAHKLQVLLRAMQCIEAHNSTLLHGMELMLVRQKLPSEICDAEKVGESALRVSLDELEHLQTLDDDIGEDVCGENDGTSEGPGTQDEREEDTDQAASASLFENGLVQSREQDDLLLPRDMQPIDQQQQQYSGAQLLEWQNQQPLQQQQNHQQLQQQQLPPASATSTSLGSQNLIGCHPSFIPDQAMVPLSFTLPSSNITAGDAQSVIGPSGLLTGAPLHAWDGIFSPTITHLLHMDPSAAHTPSDSRVL